VTRRVLQAALDAEMTDHLSYAKGDRAGRGSGNHRNGTSAKTVLTEIGPVGRGKGPIHAGPGSGARRADDALARPCRRARVWLAELKDRRIRVNVLTPGQVATAKQEEVFDEETKRQFESLIPRGKMGRPEEIATVALFLASDDSSYVNGMELVADGGTTVI